MWFLATRELRRLCHYETHFPPSLGNELVPPPREVVNCFSFFHLFLGA